MPPLRTFTYEFLLPGGLRRSYQVRLDSRSGEIIPAENRPLSRWTELDYYRCPHCPLDPAQHAYCPVASDLEALVDAFKDELSHSPCTVRVITAERVYMKEVTVQTGVYGIFGLIMATSGCPHFQFLKPMAYFHLPFSTVEETVIRVISTYLATQYFHAKNQEEADWTLAGLPAFYHNIQQVNEGIIQRLRSLSKRGDAHTNAMAILDAFASMLSLEIQEQFQSYESIFIRKSGGD
ncbi:MAG: hypothetical protein JXQ27_01530 [Acidobacteria bacterium]|nr:hypothetical protein [Acidobacteriota bacterium]